jgi:hypothetical protein
MKPHLVILSLVAMVAACSTVTTTMGGTTALQNAHVLNGATIELVQEGGFAGLAIRTAVTHDDHFYVSSRRRLCTASCGVPMDSASGTLTAGATDSLFTAVLAEKPFAMKDDYGATKGGADMFTYTVRIAADGKSKSIRFDDGTMPEPMQKILLALQSTISAARR